MANRNFNRVQALDKEIKHLYADIDVGATGAPTISKALGITSIVRSAQGDYKVTLDDKFTRLMFFQGVLEVSSAEDITFQLKAEDVAGVKTIDFFTNTGATATDPSSGSKMRLHIVVKNSSVNE